MIRKKGIASRAIAAMSGSSGLVRYEAACRAIADAKSADEVMAIRDTADAMRAAAHVAKNKQAEIDMAEIRFRGERRLGELMAAQRDAGFFNKGGGDHRVAEKPGAPITLAEAGIDKNLADRARKFAAIPEDEFDNIVGDWRGRIADENERVTTNLLKAGEKRISRDDREAELAARIAALPDRKYGVIYADPEWRFEPFSRETGMDRAADNHYPTSVTDEIAARPVESIAADDCVLFLWATAPMLPDALQVMASWGFTYKSQLVWGKDRIGTGYWARNKHELLLIGTRGNIPAPEMGTQSESLIMAPVGRHSEKPEVFAELIERYFPNLPKIELNRRGPARPGWDAWGNEALDHDPETGEIFEDSPSPVAAQAQVIADDAQAPASSAPISERPALTAGADGHPSIPTDDARGAGHGVVTSPHLDPQSSEAVTHFDNPRCQQPDGCTFAHSRNSCFDCTMAWAKRPREEQVKMWSQATQAA